MCFNLEWECETRFPLTQSTQCTFLMFTKNYKAVTFRFSEFSWIFTNFQNIYTFSRFFRKILSKICSWTFSFIFTNFVNVQEMWANVQQCKSTAKSTKKWKFIAFINVLKTYKKCTSNAKGTKSVISMTDLVT